MTSPLSFGYYLKIGWGFCGFHTWLCSSLHRDLQRVFPLRLNEWGLIVNEEQEVRLYDPARF